MGLDLFIGALARYYSGDWQTIVQQTFQDSDVEVVVVRTEPEGGRASLAEIAPVVVEWRKQLSEALAEHLEAPLDWDETAEARYFTDKPGWRCFRALKSYTADYLHDAKERYPHLLSPIDLWLPCDFDIRFTANTPAGQTLQIGSSIRLLAHLDEVNSKIWQFGDDELEKARPAIPAHGASLRDEAAFGFAVVSYLARASVEHRLPMIMDS